MNELNLKGVVVAELRQLMVVSKEYQDKITTAKTNTKMMYYKKRLRKNNHRVAHLLQMVDKLDKRHGVDDVQNINERETISEDTAP